MKEWEIDSERSYKTSSFNKNKWCKKNKLGGGKFGPHQYNQDTNRCDLCNKKDPRVKFAPFKPGDVNE